MHYLCASMSPTGRPSLSDRWAWDPCVCSDLSACSVLTKPTQALTSVHKCVRGYGEGSKQASGLFQKPQWRYMKEHQ